MQCASSELTRRLSTLIGSLRVSEVVSSPLVAVVELDGGSGYGGLKTNKQNPGRSIYVPKAPVLCVPCIGVVVAPMFSKDVKITHVRTYSCLCT
jgi:hypothetical protein